jgi:uncharacterized protein YggE
MAIRFTPAYRGLAVGGLAAAALIGAFTLGDSNGSAASPSAKTPAATPVLAATTTNGTGGITVTGTGNVTGTPNQLILSMGVQVNGGSVDTALGNANAAVNRVTAALRADGVATADIQTSGLSIYPNYPNNSQTPNGYSVSETLTATLNNIKTAGGQISDAVHAGGNATTVSGVSLNLTDTSSLLAQARVRAVADAKVKAAQYAKALGEPLGPVVSITDQAVSQPYPVFDAAGAASAKSAVPISPGSQQLSVSVTVVFAL